MVEIRSSEVESIHWNMYANRGQDSSKPRVILEAILSISTLIVVSYPLTCLDNALKGYRLAYIS